VLLARLTDFRQRLDALRSGQVRAPTFFARALAFLGHDESLRPLEILPALDRELDKVGLHTAQDVKLLREVGVRRGRAAALAEGLLARAGAALEEMEDRLGRLERALLAGAKIPGGLTTLEQAFPRLARVVKVADLFQGALPEEPNRFEIFARARPVGRTLRPSSARVAVAEFWAERARENPLDLVQKRRDLDAAHELLLRLGSDFDRDRVRLLRTEVAHEREKAREGAPVRSLEELVRELRGTAHRLPQSLYPQLRGLYERAVFANDEVLAGTTRAALEALLPSPELLRSALEHAEGAATREWLALPSPTSGREPQKDRIGVRSEAEDLLSRLAFSLDEAKLSTFELAAGCARFFDVEEALADEGTDEMWVMPERRRSPRRVPYPTQRMTFETTGSLSEVNHFVIHDPRTFLYDLASGRLAVRAYLEEEVALPKPRKVKRTAVRVYVCDASGSMSGARSRFRDALLIAELNNLRKKALLGQPVDPLYYCFFNDTPTQLARVDTASEATAQIVRLFDHSPAFGQTHITFALTSAFESIRAAQGKDPYLARATVVLITDGEDRVDLEHIRAARAPLGSLEISLSFISLGEENPDLKSLVMEQRKEGGRAFYHHLSDREISAARTEFDLGPLTLLPREVPVDSEALARLLPHLEALEQLSLGRTPGTQVNPETSFDAVFPEDVSTLPLGEVPLASDVDRVADILEAIAEAGSLAPADARGGESVTLLIHLLQLYLFTVPRYLSVLAAAKDGRVHENLARVRLICRPFG